MFKKIQNYSACPLLSHLPPLPCRSPSPVSTPKTAVKEDFTSKPTLMRHAPTLKSGTDLKGGKAYCFSESDTLFWEQHQTFPQVISLFRNVSKFKFDLKRFKVSCSTKLEYYIEMPIWGHSLIGMPSIIFSVQCP